MLARKSITIYGVMYLTILALSGLDCLKTYSLLEQSLEELLEKQTGFRVDLRLDG